MNSSELLDPETPTTSLAPLSPSPSQYSYFPESRRVQPSPPVSRDQGAGPLGSAVQPPPALQRPYFAATVNVKRAGVANEGEDAGRKEAEGTEPSARPHTARPLATPSEQCPARAEDEMESASPLLSLPPMMSIQKQRALPQSRVPGSAPPGTFLSLPAAVPGQKGEKGEEEEGSAGASNSRVVHVPPLTLVDVKAASAASSARSEADSSRKRASARKTAATAASSPTDAVPSLPRETSNTLTSMWYNLYSAHGRRRSSVNPDGAPPTHAKEKREDDDAPFDFFNNTTSDAEDAMAQHQADASPGLAGINDREKSAPPAVKNTKAEATTRSSITPDSAMSTSTTKEQAKRARTPKDRTRRTQQDRGRAKRLSTAPGDSCLYSSASSMLHTPEEGALALDDGEDTMKRIVQDALRRHAEQAEAKTAKMAHPKSCTDFYLAAPNTPTVANGAYRKRADSDKSTGLGSPVNTFTVTPTTSTATSRLNAAIKDQKRYEPKPCGPTPAETDQGGSLSLDSSVVAPAATPQRRDTPNHHNAPAAAAAAAGAEKRGGGGGRRSDATPPLFTVPTFTSQTPVSKDAGLAAAQKEEASDRNDVSSSKEDLNDPSNTNHNNPFTTMSFKCTAGRGAELPLGLLSPTLLSPTSHSHHNMGEDMLMFGNTSQTTTYATDGVSQDSRHKRAKRNSSNNHSNNNNNTSTNSNKDSSSRRNDSSLQSSAIFGNATLPSSFFQIIAESRRHTASTFQYNTAEMLSLTSEGYSNETRRESPASEKKAEKEKKREREEENHNNKNNINSEGLSFLSDVRASDGAMSLPPSICRQRNGSEGENDTEHPSAKPKTKPSVVVAVPASATVAAMATTIKTTTVPTAATIATTTTAAAAATDKSAPTATAPPAPAPSSNVAPTPNKPPLKIDTTANGTPTTKDTSPIAVNATPHLDSSPGLPIEMSGSLVLDLSYEYQNPSSLSNHRASSGYDMADVVHDVRNRPAAAAKATEKEAAYLLHEVIDELEEESAESSRDSGSDDSDTDNDGQDGGEESDSGDLSRGVEHFKKVNKINSGGSGLPSVDLLRARRILNLRDFRKFFLPESFLYETAMTMHYEAPAAATSSDKRPVAASRNYNIEVYKVKERNSQRRYAAHAICCKNPVAPPSLDGETRSSRSGSDNISDGDDRPRHRMTPVIKQQCALALLLQHPHILHTYDILVDADEDKQEIVQEVRRLSQLFFPKEKGGSDAAPQVTIVPKARGSSGGGVSFISPPTSVTPRAREAAAPRDETSRPTPPRVSSEEKSGSSPAPSEKEKEDSANKKVARLTQNVQHGHVVYMLIAELASPFEFLLNNVPPPPKDSANDDDESKGGGSGGKGRRQKALTLSAAQVADLARDAAAALHYLHTLPPTIASNYFVLHGSIAPHAIMLDVNHRLKLCCLSSSGWSSRAPVAGLPTSGAMPVYFSAALDTFLAPELYTPVKQRLQLTLMQLSEQRDGGEPPCVNGFYLLPRAALQRYYKPAIDIWALGAFLYELVVGEQPDVLRRPPPAADAPTPCTVRLVRKKKMGLPRVGRKSLRQRRMAYLASHPDLLDLLQRMLCVNPASRLSAAEVLAHPFLQEKGAE